MKRMLSATIVIVLLFTLSLSAFAEDTPSQKEEAVYGILNLDGSVNSIYVVNIFSGGEITDYGNYTKIQNMTTPEKLDQNGDKVTVNTKADKLYYQGTLESRELPWNIAIKYILDGKEISAAELAGKSGQLQIWVSVSQNTNVNSTFFNNYALQITLKLDTKLCDSIKASGAAIAGAGSKKQLSYTVLPGKGANISVTADVHDFEMEAITINGIKLVLDMNINYDELSREISQLADAIKQLDDGAGDLLDGMDQLSGGMKKYIEGLKAFKNGLSELDNGIGKLDSGAAVLKYGLSELAKQKDNLVNGALSIQQAAFDTVNAQFAANGSKLPVLTPENYSAVLSNISGIAEVKAQLDGVVQFTEGLKNYTNGVERLGEGATEFANGTSQLKTSASRIASAANGLYNAGVNINSAVKKLRDGLAAYKDGTKKLSSGTLDIDSVISDKINEMLGSISGGNEPVMSFVSSKNTNTSAVQFVLRTSAIEKQEIVNTEAVKSTELNFWQKLLKLFGLYD